MRRKLSLEELELELPKIETKETRFLLGGTGYSQDDISPHPPIENDRPYQEPLPPLNPEGPHIDETPDPVGEEMPDDSSGDQDQGGYGDQQDNEYPDPDDYGDYDPDPMNDNPPPPDGGTNTNGNGSSGTSGNVPLPSSLTDGINFSNFDLSFEDPSQAPNYEGFISQLSGLFRSNSVIANLISQIEANGSKVEFKIADLSDEEGDTLAGTTLSATDNTITIIFDSSDIGQNGWQNTSNATNGQGTDLIQYENATQSLLSTTTHELTHAVINSMMHNSVQLAEEANGPVTSNAIYDNLVNNFGQNIADIFMYIDGNGIARSYSTTQIAINQHDFMFSDNSNYNVYLERAILELEYDIQDYERYKYELERRQEEEGRDDDGPGHEEQGHG